MWARPLRHLIFKRNKSQSVFCVRTRPGPICHKADMAWLFVMSFCCLDFGNTEQDPGVVLSGCGVGKCSRYPDMISGLEFEFFPVVRIENKLHFLDALLVLSLGIKRILFDSFHEYCRG